MKHRHRKRLEEQLERINCTLSDIDVKITSYLTHIVGIAVTPGQPVPRSPLSPVSKEIEVSKPTVTLVKKSDMPKLSRLASKAAATGTAFVFIDNEDDTCTVTGVDASGVGGIDISGVATLAVTSDTPAVCTVDPPAGMTFKMHGLTPGSANITAVATWTSPTAGIGPWTFVLPLTLTFGPVSGIVITPGVPSIR